LEVTKQEEKLVQKEDELKQVREKLDTLAKNTQEYERKYQQALVENMECSFVLRLTNGTRLLQQIGFDVGPRDEARSIEVDPDEFALQSSKR